MLGKHEVFKSWCGFSRSITPFPESAPMSPSSGVFSSFSLTSALLLLGTAFVACAAFVEEYKSGIVWPEPKIVDPGAIGGPPSDAIVLFDGKDLSQWEGGDKWEIKDGYAVAREAGITTRDGFGDCQLHVEWASPAEVTGEGQGRGN